jgi:hypothetical protein
MAAITSTIGRPVRFRTALSLVVALTALLVVGLGADRALAATVSVSPGDPPPTRSTASKTFSFSGDTGATFRCSIDGGGFAPCSSPVTVPSGGSPTGITHTLTVEAANPDTTTASATRTWIVDTQAPAAPVLDEGPGEFSKTAEFKITTESTATLQCVRAFSPDLPPFDSEYATCTSPKAFKVPDGRYRFWFRARDAVGPGPAVSRGTTVDSVAPSVSLGYPSNLESLAMPSIRFTPSEEGVAVRCSLDGVEPTACATPWTPGAPLPVGPHALALAPTDRAGNVGEPNVLRWTFRGVSSAFDTTNPTVPGGKLPPGRPSGRYGPLMSPFPIVRIAGALLGDRSRVRLLTVRGPRGMTIRVKCRGRGCPRSSSRTKPRSTRASIRWLSGAMLSRGAVVQVRVSQSGRTGKYTKFVFRHGRAPERNDACLLPGGSRPVSCPAG